MDEILSKNVQWCPSESTDFRLPTVRNQQVFGSSPSAGSSFQWSIPVTWVTVYSEDIGNTFDPKGFWIGSSLHVS